LIKTVFLHRVITGKLKRQKITGIIQSLFFNTYLLSVYLITSLAGNIRQSAAGPEKMTHR